MQDVWWWEDKSVWLVIHKIQELESEQATDCASSFRCQCHFGKCSFHLPRDVLCCYLSFPLAWVHGLCNHPSKGKGNNLLL